MNKYLKTLLIAALLFPSTMLFSQDAEKVLMLVRDGSRDLELMVHDEVLVMKQMLEAAGFVVEVATVDGKDLIVDGVTLQVDHVVADLSMDTYAGLLLPCMGPAAGATVEAKVVELVKAADAAGKPIAASRSSVEFLAEAGVLEGHNYAFASAVNAEARPSFAGATFSGTGTVEDGHLTTNGICPISTTAELPDGTRDLMQSLIKNLQAGG
jgi:protease I